MSNRIYEEECRIAELMGISHEEFIREVADTPARRASFGLDLIEEDIQTESRSLAFWHAEADHEVGLYLDMLRQPDFERFRSHREVSIRGLQTIGQLFTKLDIDEALNTDIEWLVKGFLPKSYLAVLGGKSKSGKTQLAMNLAIAVATGTPFLGHETVKKRVLWLAFEESKGERALVLRAAFKDNHLPRPDPRYFWITEEKLYLDDPYCLALLEQWIKCACPGLIVIDPLHGANAHMSLSDGAHARRVLSGLKDLCRCYGCAALVIHHFTKNERSGVTRDRLSDSGQILAAASMDILMETKTPKAPSPDLADESCGASATSRMKRASAEIGTAGSGEGVGGEDVENKTPGRRITLHVTGRGEFANTTILVHSPGQMQFKLVARGTDVNWDSADQPEPLLDLLQAGDKTVRELVQESGLSQPTVSRRIKQFLADGRVKSTGYKGRAAKYSFTYKAMN